MDSKSEECPRRQHTERYTTHNYSISERRIKLDIEFLSTDKFEADMKRMSKDNQVRIKKKINFLAETLECNSEDILLSTYLHKLKVYENIQPEDSSL